MKSDAEAAVWINGRLHATELKTGHGVDDLGVELTGRCLRRDGQRILSRKRIAFSSVIRGVQGCGFSGNDRRGLDRSQFASGGALCGDAELIIWDRLSLMIGHGASYQLGDLVGVSKVREDVESHAD